MRTKGQKIQPVSAMAASQVRLPPKSRQLPKKKVKRLRRTELSLLLLVGRRAQVSTASQLPLLSRSPHRMAMVGRHRRYWHPNRRSLVCRVWSRNMKPCLQVHRLLRQMAKQRRSPSNHPNQVLPYFPIAAPWMTSQQDFPFSIPRCRRVDRY